MINRKRPFVKACFSLLLVLLLTSKVWSDTRPNILFILADDHTTQAISCYGGHLKDYASTNNIDRLAEEGVRLSHCFCNNSICTPSRASLLTGQYSHNNGVFLLDQPLPPESSTWTKSLQKAGYQTGLFGKWHLVSQPRGFDTYQIFERQGDYLNPEFLSSSDEEPRSVKGWSTDIITDMTIDFMKSCDRSSPFLAMCQYKATHDPWDSREPHRSLWKNESLPEPESLVQTFGNDRPAGQRTTLKLEKINQSTFPHSRLQNVDNLTQRRHIYQQYIKSFLRCGRVLDENVGRLLDFLDESGLGENTVVIYTADQGHFLGEHGFFSKRFMYDESLRVPFIIRFPDRRRAGKVCHDMISNIDIAPTMLDLTEIESPGDTDGKSFLPNLMGNTPKDWPEAIYYQYWQHLLHRNVTAHCGIRTKTEKLIHFHGRSYGMTDYPDTPESWEYYDLEEDPGEMQNRIGSIDSQQSIRELRTLLNEFKSQVNQSIESAAAKPGWPVIGH